jgi:hypothetical protein
MSSAMLTFAITPEYRTMLDITMPGKLDYATRYGYAIVELDGIYRKPQMSVGWWKVAALIDLLAAYDTVLYLDADVMLCDLTMDIATLLEPEHWQIVTMHNGEPNVGVWLVTPFMLPALHELLSLEPTYRGHAWYEQAALMSLLGYVTNGQYSHVQDTELWQHTTRLDAEWNWHPICNYTGHKRFKHAAAYPVKQRLEMLRSWQAVAA